MQGHRSGGNRTINDAFPQRIGRILLWISTDYLFPAMMTTQILPFGPVSQSVPLLKRSLAMPLVPDVSGNAALAIVESLLLALKDHAILPEAEIVGILRDAASAHAHMPESPNEPGQHAAIAALINQILAGGNSVRRR